MGFLGDVGDFFTNPVVDTALGAGAGFLIGGPAGAAIGGSLGAGVSSAFGAQKAAQDANEQQSRIAQAEMNFSADQAARQMAFQTSSADTAFERSEQSVQQLEKFQLDSSNTAYQRAVADMRLAGLNPALAYPMGGAGTPSGSMPSVFSPSGAQGLPAGFNPNIVPPIASSLLNSSLDIGRFLQGVSESFSRIRKNNADAGMASENTKLISADAYIEGLKKKFYQGMFGDAKSLDAAISAPISPSDVRIQTKPDLNLNSSDGDPFLLPQNQTVNY